MDEQIVKNVIYTYNKILSSLTKEGNSDVCYNMNDPWGCYAKWNSLKKTNATWFHLHEVLNIVKIIEWCWHGLGGGDNAEFVFTRYSLSFTEGMDYRDSGDARITLWMNLIPLNCTLSNG